MPGKIGMTNVGRFVDTTELGQFQRYVISGVTRDSIGSPLGGVTVNLFESATSLFRGSTISDASGNYSIEASGDRSTTFFIEAYLAGSPDVSGTTVNTLMVA